MIDSVFWVWGRVRSMDVVVTWVSRCSPEPRMQYDNASRCIMCDTASTPWTTLSR